MKRPNLTRANARIRKLVGDMHARVDQEHDKPEKQHPGIQCRPGCASAPKGCCSLITVVEVAEVEYIVARNRETAQRLLPRIRKACEQIEAAVSTEDFVSMFGDKEAEAQVAEAYHAAGIVCPFLDEERRCSIYRDRPLACRTHFVLSPPEECEATGENLNHVTLDKGTRITAQTMLIAELLRLRSGGLCHWTLPQLVLRVLERDGEASS